MLVIRKGNNCALRCPYVDPPKPILLARRRSECATAQTYGPIRAENHGHCVRSAHYAEVRRENHTFLSTLMGTTLLNIACTLVQVQIGGPVQDVFSRRQCAWPFKVSGCAPDS
jgi:hypothetical protein